MVLTYLVVGFGRLMVHGVPLQGLAFRSLVSNVCCSPRYERFPDAGGTPMSARAGRPRKHFRWCDYPVPVQSTHDSAHRTGFMCLFSCVHSVPDVF
jgi:hypothetical protein